MRRKAVGLRISSFAAFDHQYRTLRRDSQTDPFQTLHVEPPGRPADSLRTIPLAKILNVISVPTRWYLLRELASGEPLMVSELAERLGQSPRRHLQEHGRAPQRWHRHPRPRPPLPNRSAIPCEQKRTHPRLRLLPTAFERRRQRPVTRFTDSIFFPIRQGTDSPWRIRPNAYSILVSVSFALEAPIFPQTRIDEIHRRTPYRTSCRTNPS
jgi:hypothetical protein